LNKNIAIEVKETPSKFDTKTLIKRAKPLELEKAILIVRYIAPIGYKDFIYGVNIF